MNNCQPGGGGGSCSIPGPGGPNLTPAVPPRNYRSQVPAMPSTGYYGGSMMPFGGGGYGSYGSYGSYYGGGYGGIGIGSSNTDLSSDLEQSWRQAFSSVESIVRTCSSVTMMLDSTYFAVFNCFRAVVGLGEHFGDIRAQLGRFVSMFPVVRWALRLVRFLLRIIGLSHLMPEYMIAWLEQQQGDKASQLNDATLADAWASSSSTSLPALPDYSSSNSSGGLWSLGYFCLVFGLPWLLWKLMSHSVQQNMAKTQWFRSGTAHPVAVAQFDFQSDRSDELSFLRGCKIHLAPLEQQPNAKSGWLLGTVDGKRFGMVPKNYLAPPTLAPASKQSPVPKTQQSTQGIPYGSALSDSSMPEPTILNFNSNETGA